VNLVELRESISAAVFVELSSNDVRVIREALAAAAQRTAIGYDKSELERLRDQFRDFEVRL
jgi:hypothetical protein